MSPADQTVRQRMIDLLSREEMTDRELSQALGIAERDVYAHLPHVARSLKTQGKKLEAAPVRCMQCGYVFRDRKRWTRPSRCPRCKESHIERPSYRIVEA